MNSQNSKYEYESGFGRLAFVVVLLFVGWISLCRASEPTLELRAGDWSRKVTLEEMTRELKIVETDFFDPVYKRKMNFEGFELSDVLKLFNNHSGDEIVFTAEDGFAPSMLLDAIRNKRGVLVFAEKGKSGGWSEFQTGKVTTTPAPFYLVWEGSAMDEGMYPRPYKLVKIELVSLKAKFPKVFPRSGASHGALGGFSVFRKNCLMCHSMNLQGGEIGPELNLPKNITEYRNEKMLRAFISKVSSFRARSKMPDFPQLTKRDLDGLMAYLKYMRGQKIAP